MSWPIPLPGWFWLWAQWRLGRGPYKGHACDPALRPKDAPSRIPAWAWARLKVLIGPTPKPPPQTVTMFDSVDVMQIPADAAAVAGYVNGRWQTFPELEKLFPTAHRLSIAVTVHADAECLDVEKGDATPDQALAWVKRQLALGVKRPVVYTFLAQAATLQAALKDAHITRDEYRLWTAHWIYKPHRCNPACGFGFKDTADATQYSDHALGRNLDASLCAPDFFATDV